MGSPNFLRKLMSERRVSGFHDGDSDVWELPGIGITQGQCRIDRSMDGTFIVTFVGDEGHKVEFMPNGDMRVYQPGDSTKFETFNVDDELSYRGIEPIADRESETSSVPAMV